MKKIASILIACIIAIALVGCNESSHEGEAKTPSASSAQKGRDYQEVFDDFKSKGFTNIKTEELDDLIAGWLAKDGEVESVSVDGNQDYSADAWYPNDVEAAITYHSFPKDEEQAITTPTEVIYYNDTSEVIGDTEKDTKIARRLAAYDIAKKQPDVILTKDNNTELSSILLLKDPGDPSVETFALNYYGWTIEFDGNISNVANYKNFDNYFNVLVGSGNYSETETYGPNFQFKNIGSGKYPSAFIQGQNVHIKATVGVYDENSQLFELTPISIEAR